MNEILNIIRNYTNNNIVVILIFIILFGFPTLFVGWALVDDGKSAQVAYDLTHSLLKFNLSAFLNNLLEYDSGRFRPGYWLYLWITFLIAQNSALWHHFIHLLLFFFSAFLIYLLGEKSTKKGFVGVLAAILFIIDWQVLENWYRLGPQEPIVIPFLLGSLLLFLKSREVFKISFFIYSTLLLVFSFFIKETNIAFIGVPLFIFAIDLILRKNRQILVWDGIYLLSTFLAAILVRLLATIIYSGGDYTNYYQIDLVSLKINALSYITMLRTGYSPLLEILIGTFLLRFLFYFKKEGFSRTFEYFYWQFLFLSWFISFFVIQLPWGFTIGRYLQVSLVGLFLFLSFEFSYVYRILKSLLDVPLIKKRQDLLLLLRMFNFSLFLVFITVIFYQCFMSYIYINYVTEVTNFNEKVIKEIATHAPKDGRVFLNVESRGEPNLELFMEIGWHLKYVFDRPDIRYSYIPTTDYKPQRGDLIVNDSVPVILSREELKSNKSYEVVSRFQTTPTWVVLASPLNILERTPGLLFDSIMGKKIFTDHFFVISVSKYEWEVYKYNAR